MGSDASRGGRHSNIGTPLEVGDLLTWTALVIVSKPSTLIAKSRRRVRRACQRLGSAGNIFVGRLYNLLWFGCLVVCALIATSHLLFDCIIFTPDCNFAECQIVGQSMRECRALNAYQSDR